MTRTTGTAGSAGSAGSVGRAQTAGTAGTPSDLAPDGGAPAPPGGPWEVRRSGTGGGHRRGRAALEVYEHGELLDVVVASRLSSRLLRGARRSTGGGRRVALAWGRLPACGPLPVVEFTTGRLPLRRRARVVTPAVTVSGAFWLAWAEGPFTTVRLRDATGGAPAERLRLVRARGAGVAAGGPT